MNDSLGDRMKAYEKQETHARFLPNVPIVARIDGRCFSKFTKGMVRPFDEDFNLVMRTVTKQLVAETGANIGYTQSDEINLCWYTPHVNSEIFFGGRKFKMTAQLAALATAYFILEGLNHWPERVPGIRPTFDARVFQVPTLAEGANAFLWRQRDARRNSVSMIGRHYFTHRTLMHKSTAEVLELLELKCIDYKSYPWQCRNGVFMRKQVVERYLTDDEITGIPEHNRPTGPVKRNEYREFDFPLLSDLSNPVEVIFDGAQPLQRIVV